jgi:hypothetical protein
MNNKSTSITLRVSLFPLVPLCFCGRQGYTRTPWGLHPLLPPLPFMTSIKRWEMHEETTLLQKQYSPTYIYFLLLFLLVAAVI